MDETSPYLSVVVTARNDDHGGNLLRRMQTFVNALIDQCKRHDLPTELILVEWNPPPERDSLLRALNWPADLGPCRVRVIQVPAEIHRRYKCAENLPLYQMIAKNVGIRRSRGQFILATNIDIIFSDELMQFVAGRRLERGLMFRLDRYDVMKDVPMDGSLEEQLDYCRKHLIRINAQEGTFNLTPEGRRALAKDDVAEPGSGIAFGPGWYGPCRDLSDQVYRWAGQAAEVSVSPTAASNRMLRFDLEAGPSAGGKPIQVRVEEAAGTVLTQATFRRRMSLAVALPQPARPQVLWFRVDGGALPVANDPHILNFRVLRVAWAERAEKKPEESSPATTSRSRRPEAFSRLRFALERLVRSMFAVVDEQDIARGRDGIALGGGWYPPESSRGESFRWVEKEAELIVRTAPGPPRRLVTKVQPGPAVGFKRSTLEIRDHAGQVVASVVLNKLQNVEFSLPWLPGQTQVFSLRLKGGGAPVATPGDPRALRFRVFRLAWSGPAPTPDLTWCRTSQPDVSRPSSGFDWGAGWQPPERAADGDLFRSALNGAEIILRPPLDTRILCLELEPGPGVRFAPFELELRDAVGATVARDSVHARQVVELALPHEEGGTRVLTLHAGAREVAVDPPAPVFRLYGCDWGQPRTEALHPVAGLPNEIVSPVDLHTNACGDFTLMAREHWFELRGYPEFDLYSLNIDSVFCYAAFHAGVKEHILRDPFRIYHIEHASGSGWTPEGQQALYERLLAKGISWVDWPEVCRWAVAMRRLNAPMIFNLENWGLAEDDLPETLLR